MNREADQKKEIFGAEKDFLDSWLELIVAIVLGLATLGSAWSAYQSGLWNGIQIPPCRVNWRRTASRGKSRRC
jgi:hypothetical protein